MMKYEKGKIQRIRISKNNKFINSVISLDIETTSVVKDNGKWVLYDENKKEKYYEGKEKSGICYIWMVGIDDEVYYGRNINEIRDILEEINEKSKGKKIVIYIHNLAFEFQFLRNVLELENVFAREQRKPIKCKIKNTNIELRCSYVLSGLSLNNLSKQYNLSKKMVGDLNYNKLRNSKTKLSEEELKYCENDCLIVNEFINIMLKKYGDYSKIPLTSTGEIRKELKKTITENYRENKKYSMLDWKRKFSEYTPTFNQFKDLVKCFAGGYVHSSACYTNKIMKNVKSIDFTSSYPYVMITEKFPMGRFFFDSKVSLNKLDKNKCYILTLNFKNITSNGIMNYISLDKCKNKKLKGIVTDNGRIYHADELEITCTEQDYYIIRDNYDYDECVLIKARSCKNDYLPKLLIEFIINIYEEKSILKEQLQNDNSSDLKVKYAMVKSLLNSIYGMTVTNYIIDKIDYDFEWSKTEIDENEIKEMLKGQKENNKVMLPYSWGVWITAYARKNIWDNIHKIEDVVYVDTDSIKYIGDYDDVIEEYNNECERKINDVVKHYNLKVKDYIYTIGKFEKEKTSTEFKTLGAKKYISRVDGKLKLTLSGVNKEGVKALNDDIRNFKNGFKFKSNETGKSALCYNDNQSEIELIDYQGNKEIINQKFGICLYPVSYVLDTTGEYKDFIEKAYTTSRIIDNF